MIVCVIVFVCVAGFSCNLASRVMLTIVCMCVSPGLWVGLECVYVYASPGLLVGLVCVYVCVAGLVGSSCVCIYVCRRACD